MRINPVIVKISAAVYVFIMAGIIFVADRQSTAYLLNFIGNIPFGDKLGHFFLMGILSFLINLVLQVRSVGYGKLHYLLGSLIVFAVVAAEEVSQIFVRGRTFDLTDLAADSLGIFVFGELARLVGYKFSFTNKA